MSNLPYQSETLQRSEENNTVIVNLDIIDNTDLNLSTAQQDQNEFQIQSSPPNNKLTTENNILSNGLTSTKVLNDDTENMGLKEDNKQHSNLVDRLKYQIKSLTQEKESFEELWNNSQRTIITLETEIAHYRRQINQPNSIFALKKEAARRLKELDEKLKDAERRLEEKDKQVMALKSEKLNLDTKLSNTEFKLKELSHQKQILVNKYMKIETTLNECRKQNTTLTQEKLDLEKILDTLKRTNQNQMLKEREAITKVQEALTLAETAIAEKEACVVREKDISEECDYLARTIGHVMEEAAKTVDEDFERIRKDHQKEIDHLQSLITKHKLHSERVSKKYKSSENHLQEAEKRIQTLTKANLVLDNDLQRASKTIVDLEMKIETLQAGIKQEQEHGRICEEKAKELQNFVESNKSVKVQWKQMTLDLTSKFQNKIEKLQVKIRQLETENRILKNQLERKDGREAITVSSVKSPNYLEVPETSSVDGSLDFMTKIK